VRGWVAVALPSFLMWWPRVEAPREMWRGTLRGAWLRVATSVVSSMVALANGVAAEPAPTPSPQPAQSGLTERVKRQLAQVDVSVRGPADVISNLERADFELQIGTQQVREFTVDNLCQRNRADTTSASSASPVSFLLYFDQHHLNMMGRETSLETARSLLPRIIQNGNRGMIVSAGQRLDTVASWTADATVLLKALERLEHDDTQWDEYPYLEETRLRQVKRRLAEAGRFAACAEARMHETDEVWRTETSLLLLSAVLGRFSFVTPPSVMIYFGDTLRLEPGRPYFDAAGDNCLGGAFDARETFAKVFADASANAVRIYTVQGEGLVGLSRGSNLRERAVHYSQSGLKALALETGGDAFLNGASVGKIAARLADDLSCVYLLSFSPENLPLDKPLPTTINVKRPGVRVHVRGLTTLPSESSRRSGRLLAAFASGGSVDRSIPVEATLVPTGYEDGRHSALMQVIVRSPSTGSEWDIGASVISRGQVRKEVSMRVLASPQTDGTPIVLEAPVEIRPGPFEVVAVALELNTDTVGSFTLRGEWPDPAKAVAVGSVVALQRRSGLFLRENDRMSEGSLVVTNDRPADPSASITVDSMICGHRGATRVRVQRSLQGSRPFALPELLVNFNGADTCKTIHDEIPPGTLLPGRLLFTVEAHDDEGGAFKNSVEFQAVGER
jgi:VWFA-related protein